MMNSYRRNDGRNVRRLFLVTAAVIILFAVDFVGGGIIRGFLRSTAVSISGAGSHVVRSISESGFFSSRRVLKSENSALQEEVQRLQMNAIEVNLLRQEVEALRRLVHLAERAPGITASIVSSVISSPYGTFVIAAGEKDGITVGDLVLAGGDGQSTVIGRVSETTARHSLVTEIFAPGAHMEVSVRGAPFTLEGKGGGNARIEVPTALTLGVGDPVFAPETGGRSVGYVGAVSEELSSAYKDVFVRSSMSAASLGFVYVISQEK